MKSTGDKIKTARKQAGLTQKELGQRMGVKPQTVAQWENGLRKPKIETVQKIATALQIDHKELLGVGQALDLLEDEVYKELRDGPLAWPLMGAFVRLNYDGQQKALERVEELAEIEKYRK